MYITGTMYMGFVDENTDVGFLAGKSLTVTGNFLFLLLLFLAIKNSAMNQVTRIFLHFFF